MAINIIGKNIAELRKAKKITQEALADVVGVSSQAVSKWESGGTPDVEYLPIIADFFQISIDRLFGRNVNDYGDLIFALSTSLENLTMKEKFEKTFEYCSALEQSFYGKLTEFQTPDEIRKKIGDYRYSQTLVDEGITLMSLAENLPYFLIMPEPEAGWQERLGNCDEYVNLFNLFSNSDTLKTLCLLNKRENKAFTPKLLEKNLGIVQEKAVQILEELSKYKLIYTSEIELDDEIQKVYNFSPNPAFIAVLALAGELIHKPDFFYFNMGCREKPYFK